MAIKYDDVYMLVTNREYQRLKDRDEKLSKLEAAGVDNWDGYDWAFEDDNDDF